MTWFRVHDNSIIIKMRLIISKSLVVIHRIPLPRIPLVSFTVAPIKRSLPTFSHSQLKNRNEFYCFDAVTLKQIQTRYFSSTGIFRTASAGQNSPSGENVPEVINLTGKQSGGKLGQLPDELLLNSAVENTVAALNLGSNYTPIGWCVHYLDFLHSIFPWWGAIAVGTLLLRVCLFPFVITAQRSAAKLNEVLPEQAILKEKMNEARIVGDMVEFARLSNESLTLYQRRGIKPFRAMLAPFAQAPVFITFFLTLRRMANYPVESLKDGGIFWFTDLSIPDPFYILPVVTSATLWITLETSFRTGMNPNQTPLIKYGARIIPLVTLAFTFNFPSAILVYWCTNNLISLTQVFMLKQPAVREFLNIPQIKVNPSRLDINKKSFKQHFRETMDNAKINKILEERKTLDEITFKKAGIGPLQKTYKEDPTKTKRQ